MGLLLEAVEIIVSPEATLFARFYSSPPGPPLPLFGEGKYERGPPDCNVLGKMFPFLSL